MPASPLVGFLVRPGIRVLPLPQASMASSRVLPVHPERVRGVVELEQETVIIPDLEKLE